MAKVGFIGLGIMGGPMASNVLKKGHDLTVFDIDPKAVDKLVALGAVAASSPMAVAVASEFVITMLPDAPDVEQAALGEKGIIAGLRVVTWSTARSARPPSMPSAVRSP
jgi:4-hydroxybutyrate dehydrogenase / sulfolactaldehyde 3-reductase